MKIEMLTISQCVNDSLSSDWTMNDCYHEPPTEHHLQFRKILELTEKIDSQRYSGKTDAYSGSGLVATWRRGSLCFNFINKTCVKLWTTYWEHFFCIAFHYKIMFKFLNTSSSVWCCSLGIIFLDSLTITLLTSLILLQGVILPLRQVYSIKESPAAPE